MSRKFTSLLPVMALPALVFSGCTRDSVRSAPQHREMTSSGIPSDFVLNVVVAEGRDARVSPAKKYRGTLETINENGKTMVVNRVSVDDYVKGVMNGEVSPAWPPEALKAMAIVVRSYAYNRWLASRDSKTHMYSDVRSQEYCGINCEDIRSNAAVDETAGLVMVYNNQVIQAFSHACCAGTTETPAEVWGSSEDGGCFQVKNCQWCKTSKHFGPWMLIMEKTTLSRRLAPDLGKGLTLKGVRVVDLNESGRVKTIEVQTIWKKVRMSGAHFRSLVGWNDIRSARFQVEDRGDVIQFEGYGWGHGVGLCQEGMRKQAEEGTDADTILGFYFPGVEIWHLPR